MKRIYMLPLLVAAGCATTPGTNAVSTYVADIAVITSDLPQLEQDVTAIKVLLGAPNVLSSIESTVVTADLGEVANVVVGITQLISTAQSEIQ